MRKLLAALAVAAAALIPALSLAAAPAVTATKYHNGPAVLAAAHSRIPEVRINGQYKVQNVQSGLWMHAHTLGGQMQDRATGIQQWLIQDANSWNSNKDGTVTTVQAALVGNSGYCATWHSSDGGVYLDPCVTGFGDGSQQWWIPCAVNCSSGDWWINADASAHSPNPPHNYRYATDLGAPNNYLFVYPPGSGNEAVFTDFCQNC